jgi:hypothetical protein
MCSISVLYRHKNPENIVNSPNALILIDCVLRMRKDELISLCLLK